MPARDSIQLSHRAETQLIANILAVPDRYYDIATVISPADITDTRIRHVFEAICACASDGQAATVTNTANALKRRRKLAAIGGTSELDALQRSGDSSKVSDLAAIISEQSLRSRLHTAAEHITSIANDATADTDTLRDHTERAVSDALTSAGSSGFNTLSAVMTGVHEEITTPRNSRLVGLSTGFDQFDDITAGLQPGQLVLIAGRPGTGKSVLATQIGRHIAETSGKTVALLSYEMSTTEIGFRLLSAETGIPVTELMRGSVPVDMKQAVASGINHLSGINLLIDDTPPPTLAGARSELRRIARTTQLGAIVVDYLQLMRVDGIRDGRVEEISTISRELKLLSKELSVPVIACSQLNRALESRPNKRPMLSDLRESGSLEQDANIVMFLYREHVYNPSANERDAELIIAKNRNGKAGVTINVYWDGAHVRFTPAPASPVGGPLGYTAGTDTHF